LICYRNLIDAKHDGEEERKVKARGRYGENGAAGSVNAALRSPEREWNDLLVDFDNVII
jgi:hypothetical protein